MTFDEVKTTHNWLIQNVLQYVYFQQLGDMNQ